jgi:hypothetical protein|tara:strand:- start:9231 stop:9380 length:150 start_codon:yes stop_codon:yes gene_type:complete
MVKRSNKNKKQIDALEEEEEEVVFTRYLNTTKTKIEFSDVEERGISSSI